MTIRTTALYHRVAHLVRKENLCPLWLYKASPLLLHLTQQPVEEKWQESFSALITSSAPDDNHQHGYMCSYSLTLLEGMISKHLWHCCGELSRAIPRQKDSCLSDGSLLFEQ